MIFESVMVKSKEAWQLITYTAYFDGELIHLRILQQLVKNCIEHIDLLKKLSLVKEAQVGTNTGLVVHEIVQQKLKDCIKLKGKTEKDFVNNIRSVLVNILSSNNEGFLGMVIYFHAKKLIKYKEFMKDKDKIEFLSK